MKDKVRLGREVQSANIELKSTTLFVVNVLLGIDNELNLLHPANKALIFVTFCVLNEEPKFSVVKALQSWNMDSIVVTFVVLYMILLLLPDVRILVKLVHPEHNAFRLVSAGVLNPEAA